MAAFVPPKDKNMEKTLFKQKEENLKTNFSVRSSNKFIKELKSIAKKNNTTISEVVRTAIELLKEKLKKGKK